MSFQLIDIEVWDCKHGTGPGSQRGSGHVQARGIGTLGLAQTGRAQESGAAMWLRGAPQTEGQTRCVHTETPTDEISQQVCAVMVRVSVPDYYRMDGLDRMERACVCVIAGNGPRWPRGLGERGVRN